MSGHSKWSTIKHKKAAQDAKRGKLFTKLIKEVTVAARAGGGDIDANPRLRTAVANARGQSMPMDNIMRAIKKATGEGEGDNYEEIVYEGYGPHNVAIIVEAMTDNRNRTVAEVRHAFNKYGGNLGTDGSVAYLFTRQGVISFAPGTDEEALMDIALEAGAEDIEGDDDGAITVTTPWETLNQVVTELTNAGFEPDHSEVTMVSSTTSPCDTEQARKVLTLIDVLEDLDDVQEVYSNGEFPDDAYE